MQLTTIVALFAASVAALPTEQASQYCWWCAGGFPDALIFNPYVVDPFGPFTFDCPNPFNPLCAERGRLSPFCTDGDANGCYFSRCRCAGANMEACDLLHKDYDNIQFDPLTGSCMDVAQRGIEFNGFSKYCTQAGGFVSGCVP
ncbi:hypothetical protein AC578_5702 [Pseudocercospora eumusae]|uniref:Extracellular membrane protein CFEM domain-containing protein n=1 Tax=Pseudocercospora eumusae TaxID=321146 RepID=A0A139HEW5_9PEZI|nr:hypothetical protein AC578_5702 [Pseudocercospora eumusae]